MSTTLKTQRLTLRQFQDSDLDTYAEICADPAVMKHIGHGKTLTRAESWLKIATMLGHWQLRGYGLWAIEENTTGQLIGRAGFHNPEGWPGFELGWLLAQTHWNQGYATEAATAALTHAFTTLNRPEVISLIYPANTPSIRLAQRLGQSLHKNITLLNKPVHVYKITNPSHQPQP